LSKNILKFWVLISILFQSHLGHAKDFMSEVARANNLYANNNYQEAADVYESIHLAGLNNGYLYYNLGNTYIRLGKTGFAILNYIRARKLIPRNENLQANLNFAIQQTRDKIPLPEQSTLNTLFFWVSDLSLSEFLKSAFLINLIFWLTLIVWFYFRSKTFKLIRNLFFYMLLFGIISVIVKLNVETGSKTGVVIANKVSVKSGLDSSNATLFELHEGALVKITEERKNWYEIRLNEKQKGWVPKDTLGT
tara:strand:- start:524 stop:1273 length:750 start_codon:yes stop_codon:yes gene_type:complete